MFLNAYYRERRGQERAKWLRAKRPRRTFGKLNNNCFLLLGAVQVLRKQFFCNYCPPLPYVIKISNRLTPSPNAYVNIGI